MRAQPKHNPVTDHRELGAQTIVAVLQAGEAGCTRPTLERNLAHIEPLTLNDSLDSLHQQGVLRVAGEHINAPDAKERRHKADLLAAVVLHVLATSHRPMSTERVSVRVERNPRNPREREEVQIALHVLATDELAQHEQRGWRATRAAIRATELSF